MGTLKRILFLFFILLAPLSVVADTCEVVFFYSPTCPHCAREEIFLKSMEDKHPGLRVQRHDYSEENALYRQLSEEHDSIPVGVPRTYIGGKAFVGFTEETGNLQYLKAFQAYHGFSNQLEQAIADCLGIATVGVAPPADFNMHALWIVPALFYALLLAAYLLLKDRVRKQYFLVAFLVTTMAVLFYLARTLPNIAIINFAKNYGFPLFTCILALFDGLNPCAFAVLAVLLSLLIYSKSKARTALIGIIFIITSGLMYFLFIIALLTMRTELFGGYQNTMRILVGIVAIVAGLINLKDFFWFKKGVSLTISEGKMSRLTRKMRGITDQVKEANTGLKLFGAVCATIILAIVVNIIELGCTLILPVQYIEVLIANYGETLTIKHILYTGLYCIVYIIPLLAILSSFLYSFKSDRMTEKKGKALKLVSGLMMVSLGLLLIFHPELLAFV